MIKVYLRPRKPNYEGIEPTHMFNNFYNNPNTYINVKIQAQSVS